jgi:hypothetical protein
LLVVDEVNIFIGKLRNLLGLLGNIELANGTIESAQVNL